MKSYKAKSAILANLGLLGAFRPLLGPWGRIKSFVTKFFYSAQLDMKMQLAANFRKIDGRLSRITLIVLIFARINFRAP